MTFSINRWEATLISFPVSFVVGRYRQRTAGTGYPASFVVSTRRYARTSLAYGADLAGTSISRLRILPVGPFGSSSTNQTTRGYL